jgi:hypothetical protein
VFKRSKFCIAVQFPACLLFQSFLVRDVLLSFCQLSQKSELSVELSGTHGLSEIRCDDTSFNFLYIFKFHDPFVG